MHHTVGKPVPSWHDCLLLVDLDSLIGYNKFIDKTKTGLSKGKVFRGRRETAMEWRKLCLRKR